MVDKNNKKDSFGLLKLSPEMQEKLKYYGIENAEQLAQSWEYYFVNPMKKHFEEHDRKYKDQKAERDRRHVIWAKGHQSLQEELQNQTRNHQRRNQKQSASESSDFVNKVGPLVKQLSIDNREYVKARCQFNETQQVTEKNFRSSIAENKNHGGIASKLSQLGKIDFGLLEGLSTKQLLESIEVLDNQKYFLKFAYKKARWKSWLSFWSRKRHRQNASQLSILMRNLEQTELTLKILALKHYLSIAQTQSPHHKETQLIEDIKDLQALKSFIRKGSRRLSVFKLTDINKLGAVIHQNNKSKGITTYMKRALKQLQSKFKTQPIVIENEIHAICDDAVEFGVYKVIDEAMASLSAVDPMSDWQSKTPQERKDFVSNHSVLGKNHDGSCFVFNQIFDEKIYNSLGVAYRYSNDNDNDIALYNPIIAKASYCLSTVIPKLFQKKYFSTYSARGEILQATIRKLKSFDGKLKTSTSIKKNYGDLIGKLTSVLNEDITLTQQDVTTIFRMNHGATRHSKKSLNHWWDQLDSERQDGFFNGLVQSKSSDGSINSDSNKEPSQWDDSLVNQVIQGKESKFASLKNDQQYLVKQMAYAFYVVKGGIADHVEAKNELASFCDFLQTSCYRFSAKGMFHSAKQWFGGRQKYSLFINENKDLGEIESLRKKLSGHIDAISLGPLSKCELNLSEAEMDHLIKAYKQYSELHDHTSRDDRIKAMCKNGINPSDRRRFMDALVNGFNRLEQEHLGDGSQAATFDDTANGVEQNGVFSLRWDYNPYDMQPQSSKLKIRSQIKEDVVGIFSAIKRLFVQDEKGAQKRKIRMTQRKITRYFEGLCDELQLANSDCANLILTEGSEASRISYAITNVGEKACGVDEIKVAGKLPSQCALLVNGLAGDSEDDRIVENSIVVKFHKAFFKQVVKKYSLLAPKQDYSQIDQGDLKKLLSTIILNRLPDDSDDSQRRFFGINLNDLTFKKLRKTFRKFVKKQMTNSGSEKAMTSGQGEQDLHRNFRERKQYQLFSSILHEYAYSNEDNPESILRMNDLLKINLSTVADFILHFNKKKNEKYLSPWISKDISLLHLAKKNAMVLHALKNKQVALKKLLSSSERKRWIKVCQWAKDLAAGQQSAYIPPGKDGSFWKSIKEQKKCVELLVKYGQADGQKTVNHYIRAAENKTQKEDGSLVFYYLEQRLHELKEQYNSEGLSEAWKLEMNRLFELAKCAEKSLSTELLEGEIETNMGLFLNNNEAKVSKTARKDAIWKITHADPIRQLQSSINSSYLSTRVLLEQSAQDSKVDESKRIHAVAMLVGLPEDDLFDKSFTKAVTVFELYDKNLRDISKQENEDREVYTRDQNDKGLVGALSLSPWLSLILNGDQSSGLSIAGVLNNEHFLGENFVLHTRFKEQFPAITQHVYKQMKTWLFRYIQGNLSKQAFDVLLPYVQNTQDIPLIQAYYVQSFSAIILGDFTLQSSLESQWKDCLPAYRKAMSVNGKPELASQYKVLDQALLSILSLKMPLNKISTNIEEAKQFAKTALKLWQLMADASAYTESDKSLQSFSQFHETQEYLRQLWFRAFVLSHGDGNLAIDNESNALNPMLSRSLYHQDFKRSSETQTILSEQIYDENIKLNDNIALPYASSSNLCMLEKWGESNVDKRDESWHLAHRYLRNQRVQQINKLLSRPKQDFGSDRITNYCELIRRHSESLIMKNQSVENKKLLSQVVSEIGAEVANSVENTTRAIAGGVGITPDFIRPNLVSTALGNDGYKAISKSLDSFVQDFELLSTQHDQKAQNKNQTYQNTYKKPFDALKFFDTFATKKQWSDLFAKILEQFLGANNKDQIELFISGFQRSREWTHFELLSLRDDQKRKDVNDGALDEVSQKISRSPDLIFSQRYQVAYSKFSSDCFKNAQTQWSVQREYLFHAFADDKELFAFRVGKMQSILGEAKVHDSLIDYLKVLTLLNGSINQEKENATARLMPHDLTEAHQKLLDQTLSAHIRKSLAVVSVSSNPNELAKQEIYGYGHSLFKVVEQWSQDNVLQSSARLLFLKHLVVDQSSKMDHLDSIRSYNKTNCLDDQNQDNIYLNAGDLGHFIGYIKAIMEEEGKEFSKDVSRISAWCNLLDKQIQCHDEQAKYAKEHFSKALKFKRFVHLLVHAEDYTGQDDCLFGKGSEVFDAKAVFNLESNKEREDFSQALLDLVKGTLQSNDEIFYEWYKSYSNLQLKPKLDKIREELGKDTEEEKPESIKTLHDLLYKCYNKHQFDDRSSRWLDDLRTDKSQSNFNVDNINKYFNKHHIEDAREKIQELNTIVSMTHSGNKSSLLHAMGFCNQWKMVEVNTEIKSQHGEIQTLLARGESFIAELEKIESYYIKTTDEKVNLSSLRRCFMDELSTVRINTLNNRAPLMTAIARLFRDPIIGLGQEAFKAEKSNDQTLIGYELEKGKVYLPSAEYFTNKPNMAIYWLKALPELYEQRHFEAKKGAINDYVEAFCKGFLANNQGKSDSQDENTLTAVQKKELTDLKEFILTNIDCWQQNSNPVSDFSGNSSQSDSESSVPGSPNKTSPKVKVKPKKDNELDNDATKMIRNLGNNLIVDQDLIAQMEASRNAMQNQKKMIQEAQELDSEQAKAKKKTSQNAEKFKGSPSRAGMHGSGSTNNRSNQSQDEIKKRESATAGNNKKTFSVVAGLFGGTGNKGKVREIKDGKIETPLNRGVGRVLGKKVNK